MKLLSIYTLLLSAVTAMSAEFWVAPHGSDTAAGTEQQPFATLGKAVEAARGIPASEVRRITVRGGKFYDVAVRLKAGDSGLVIEAATGEKPVLYGGQRISNWEKAQGETWAARLPGRTGEQSAWEIRALEVDGQLAPRARFPAEGTLEHLTRFDVPWMSTTGGGWKRKPTDEELTTLEYKPGELPRDIEIGNAEVTVYHMWDESCVGVAAHDASNQVLRLAPELGHPPGAFGVRKFVVWNTREGLTRPGQWYHDRVGNRLVYWPLPGQDMAKVDVVAPTTTSILKLHGEAGAKLTNITIRGLTFAVTTVPLRAGGFAASSYDGAISLAHAADCTLDQLTVTRVGAHGINAARSVAGIRVLNSDVSQCGAGGIYVGGQSAVISNNHVHAVGRAYPSAVGIYQGGSDCLVSHNEVHDCTYSAINYGGKRNVIEDNLLYDCMKVLHDGAAIYVFGGQGTILRRNLARDFTDRGGYGASAYYLDEQCRGCVVESNVSVRVGWPSHNHMATNNTIRQNVFVVEGDAKITFPRSSGFTWERNIIHASGKVRIENPDAVDVWTNNIFHSRAGKIERVPLKQYSATGVLDGPPDGSVTGDPLFVNASAGDYRFQSGSPAVALGIQPLDVSLAGTLRQKKASATSPPLKEVIVVFKTHFDIGYTDMASNVVQRYRTTMIDEALKVVDQNRDLPSAEQFVWTLPGWPMHKISQDWPGQTPQRKTRILDALKQGRFAVHALPFTMHTELLEPEDLVRGLGFAANLSRSVGLSLPRDAKMTDVPCHSWILPTLLRSAGVDFLHLGCNAASRSPAVPVLFWWEGPDGSRLLTMYTAESYGTGLIPPKDWPHATWLALIHTGDNHGPPTPAEVTQLLAEAKRKLPGVKVRIGRLSDFADAIRAGGREIPVVRGDMPDTWIHGPMCDPAGAATARSIRPTITSAELLAAHLQAWGLSRRDRRAAIADAYEQSLLYGEHTWGGALYWVSKYTGAKALEYGEDWKALRGRGHFARLEASWKEHSSYIRQAERLIGPVLQSDMQALAQAVGVSGGRCVVFNPLPWKRDARVSVPWTEQPLAGMRCVDDETAVPAAVRSGKLTFLARSLPPLGYRTFIAVNEPVAVATVIRHDATSGTFENEFLRARVDARSGAVVSLVEKSNGRELVEPGQGLGRYLYERFDDGQVQAFVRAYVKISAAWASNELGKPNLPSPQEVPYAAFWGTNGQVSFHSGADAAVAAWEGEVDGPAPCKITTRFILPAQQPWMEIELTLHNKPADSWPEAGWMCLPFGIQSPEFRVGRLGSVIDPVRDTVAGANRHLLGINTGVALFNSASQGAGICPLDSPLVSLGEPGCWKYTLDYIPRRPRIYVNLFNNQWTTNFRLWNEGTWTSRVRVWPIEKYEAGKSLVIPSLEARYAALAAAGSGAGGRLPPTQRGLEVGPGVLVTAMCSDAQGRTTLRLWEHTGTGGSCEVRLPDGIKAARAEPIDLRGQPRAEAVPVNSGRISCALTPFGVQSFLLSAE